MRGYSIMRTIDYNKFYTFIVSLMISVLLILVSTPSISHAHRCRFKEFTERNLCLAKAEEKN